MSKRILVVDDEPDMLDVLIEWLKCLGYEAIPAVDAEEAMGILEKTLPDLILLDLLLPKMQGDEFCKKVKADEQLKHIPVILFTANVSLSSLPAKIKEMGADDFMMKPFLGQELISKISRFIG